MTVITETYIPYEFTNKYDGYRYVESRCHGIKKSLRFIDKENGHLTVRCPLSGDYIEIVGSIEDINWLHEELTRRGWYRTTPIQNPF